MQQTFTSREVIDLTGITPRQLQWWDERGIVVPAREGALGLRARSASQRRAPPPLLHGGSRRGRRHLRAPPPWLFPATGPKGNSLPAARIQQAPRRDRHWKLRLPFINRRQNSVSRNFTPANCRYPQKFPATHAGDLFKRYRTPSKGRNSWQEAKRIRIPELPGIP